MPNATTSGIGARLRSARDALGASVEEAAWKTRIRPEYLRALEEERFDACGHLAFARGHLHSYARFLGLDANALVREYAERYEGSQPSSIEQLNERVKVFKRPAKPNWVIAAIVAAAILVAASLTGIFRGPGPRTNSVAGRDPLSTLPASTQPGPGSSAPAVAGPAAAAPTSVTLVIAATGRCWVRVISDSQPAFEGVLDPGASRTFTAGETIDLTVGAPSEVRLILNGHDLGSPGGSGVYHVRLGPRGPVPAK